MGVGTLLWMSTRKSRNGKISLSATGVYRMEGIVSVLSDIGLAMEFPSPGLGASARGAGPAPGRSPAGFSAGGVLAALSHPFRCGVKSSGDKTESAPLLLSRLLEVSRRPCRIKIGYLHTISNVI